MGYGYGSESGKFYQKQVSEVERLLERFVKQTSQIDIEKSLKICEQLGQEPDPEKMPLETSAFPYEVQVAFFIYSLLPDIWDTNSGFYLGKNWSECPYLFELYSVDSPREVLYFAKTYERMLIAVRAEELERKQKAEERKASAGGKNFTHNVKG